MSRPLISIIVPVFEVERTLARCVDSILAQDYENIEVLLIDDGSTDRSGRIIDDYAAMSVKVRAFHKENGGLSSARNYGLDRCLGDYIAFVDSDDYIENSMISVMLEKIRRHDADICACGHYNEYPGKTVPRPTCTSEQLLSSDEALHKLIVEKTIKYGVWDKLYKRSVFDEERFDDGYIFEDSMIMWRLFLRADRIVSIPDMLYHYMQYNQSLSHFKTVKSTLDSWLASRLIYDNFAYRGKDYELSCARRCMNAGLSAWSAVRASTESERAKFSSEIADLSAFFREKRRRMYMLRGVMPLHRLLTFMLSVNRPFSFFLVDLLRRAYSGTFGRNKKKMLFDYDEPNV